MWSALPDSPRQSTEANPNQEVVFGDDFSPNSSLSLAVKVSGYHPIQLPIPLDAIGIVVRSTAPDSSVAYLQRRKSSQNMNNTRIIFRITLNSRRQKVVYAESAVRLMNHLPHGLALAFTDTANDDPSENSSVVTLDTGESIPLPLASLNKFLWFRPLKPGIGFCHKPIQWHHITQPALPVESNLICSNRSDNRNYNCVVSVVKRQSHFQESSQSDPWHVITVSAPIVIKNLLPCDMAFELTETIQSGKNTIALANDRLLPGRSARLTVTDSSATSLQLAVNLDSYPYCNPVSVMLNQMKLCVLDESKRPLWLTMTVKKSRHGVLLVSHLLCFFFKHPQ